MTVAQQGSHFARNFFTALLPILQQWLSNARASYTALTTLLGQVPGVGAHLKIWLPSMAWHCAHIKPGCPAWHGTVGLQKTCGSCCGLQRGCWLPVRAVDEVWVLAHASRQTCPRMCSCRACIRAPADQGC